MIICQLYTPEIEDYASISVKNISEYCDVNGYVHHALRDVRSFNRHPSWNRVPFLLDTMKMCDDNEWLCWIDVDILAMDFSKRIDSFCNNDYNMVLSCQGRGLAFGYHFEHCLNFGLFFLRNTEWSRKLLKGLWLWTQGDYEKYRHEKYWDNDAVNFFWKKNINSFDKNVYIDYNPRNFNSFYEKDLGLGGKYEIGDPICHFTDMSSEDRMNLMKEFSKKVVK